MNIRHIHINETDLHHAFYAAAILKFRDAGWKKDRVEDKAEMIVEYLKKHGDEFREKAVDYLESYRNPEEMVKIVLPAFYSIEACKFVDKIVNVDIAQWN